MINDLNSAIPVSNTDSVVATSRYKGSSYYKRYIEEVGNVIDPNVWQAPEIPEQDSDQFTDVDPGEAGRLDLVSYRVYRIEALWWVIAVANDIVDPIAETTTGRRLRYPSFDWVAANILA
jgi:hypothetical protein